MPSPFIVLFTARSGSTALVGHLKKHPDVVMGAEVFGGKALPNGSEQTDENRLRFLRQFWAAFEGGQRIAHGKSRGFKLQIGGRHSQFSDSNRLIETLKSYRAKVIVLSRSNILKQAISALNAQRLLQVSQSVTGNSSAHVKKEQAHVLESLAAEKLVVDRERLTALLESIRHGRAQLFAMADALDGCLRTNYENLVADPASFYREIEDFIGLDPSQRVEDGDYLKITSDNLVDVVQNYDELCAFVKGTELEPMLAPGA